MDANRSTASRTGPSFSFLLQELFHTGVPNTFQVGDHAHAVFGPVSFVQMFQVFAGKIVTSKTKFYFPFLHHFAVFDFASNNGNCFMGIFCPATGTFIFLPQISHANATVHAAGGDQGRIEGDGCGCFLF
jgi:hypothetical protein